MVAVKDLVGKASKYVPSKAAAAAAAAPSVSKEHAAALVLAGKP